MNVKVLGLIRILMFFLVLYFVLFCFGATRLVFLVELICISLYYTFGNLYNFVNVCDSS